MKTVFHAAHTRGHFDYGWLRTYHSFSFSEYRNPERMHFGLLRVLNDDYVAGGTGFGLHPHDNMEIVTVMLEGILEHQDSMGNRRQLLPGEVQVMSAGSGLRHSEYNASTDEPLNLLQIWVYPQHRNTPPRYDQKAFDAECRHNRWQYLVAPDGAEGALHIGQQAWFVRGQFEAGSSATYRFHRPDHGLYVFVIDGQLTANGHPLSRRDGLGIWKTESVDFDFHTAGDVLLIEVPLHQPA
jgi:redox-sensitive bicupin YhaK (pirin superfamily)